jgi:uncharacterized glyoxalase superfamily protein PhnB
MTYKPDDCPGLIPYLVVRDAEKAVDFYQKAFGFTLTCGPHKGEDGKIQHVEMRYEDTMIMFCPEGAWGQVDKKAPATQGVQSPIVLYVYCKDVDAFYQNAVKNGAEALGAPEDCFWGDRMCRLGDQDGYQWSFATNTCEHKK